MEYLSLQQEIKDKIPLLDDRQLLDEIVSKGTLRSLEIGMTPMQYGQFFKQVPLVLDGLIKITSQNEQGDEILLYYLQQGSSCPTAFNCCVANRPSDIKATIEEPTRIISLPIELVDEWLGKYQSWKKFVMNSYQIRFKELLKTVDDIAFAKVDERLISYLQKKRELTGKNTLHVTHQQIANDLNTSREVVSRLLKKIEKKGSISLERNKITIH